MLRQIRKKNQVKLVRKPDERGFARQILLHTNLWLQIREIKRAINEIIATVTVKSNHALTCLLEHFHDEAPLLCAVVVVVVVVVFATVPALTLCMIPPRRREGREEGMKDNKKEEFGT